MSNSRIVIGDVHGCYNTLMKLIEKLPKRIPITFAGDLIDRGPDSNKVIEFVKSNGYDCVKGNHEDLMVTECKIEEDADGKEDVHVNGMWNIWLANGGATCLTSYILKNDSDGIEYDIEKLKEHKNFLSSLPVFIEYPELKNNEGRYLVVSHSSAGAVWGVRNETDPHEKEIVERAIMWNRGVKPDVPEIYNIFGHTPITEPYIADHCANIDTGAVFKSKKDRGYANLTALQFPEMIIYQQENIED